MGLLDPIYRGLLPYDYTSDAQAARAAAAARLARGVRRPNVLGYPIGSSSVPDSMPFAPSGGERPSFTDLLRQTWPARLANDVVQAAATPGRVATGAFTVKPEVPGQWSEIDELRQQKLNEEMIRRSTDLAGVLMSTTLAGPRAVLASGASRPPKPPLPMDAVSRMARARELGYDLDMPLYKGIASDVPVTRLDPTLRGTVHPSSTARAADWSALKRDTAEFFADSAAKKQKQAPQVLELLHRADKRMEFSATGKSRNEIAAQVQQAWNNGFDAVIVRDWEFLRGHPRADFLAVKNENQLRLKNAAFDPARRDENDLLASLGSFLPLPLAWRSLYGTEDRTEGGAL